MTNLPGKKLRQNHKRHLDEPRYIRPVKRVKLPSNCLFFDTETETIDDDGTQAFKLAVAVHCKYRYHQLNNNPTWFESEKPVELYKFITGHVKVRQPLKVMSANIWFDLRVSGLLEFFHADKWKCRHVYISHRIFFAIFTKNKYTIEFINIQNYFNMSVAKIGKSIGLPKLEIDFDDTSIDRLFEYCKRDVEIIYMAFSDYVNYITKNEIGSVGYTVTGTAFNIYRKSFMTKWIRIHAIPDITELERQVYYGGRCECFHIGYYDEGPYYKLDVNSMYPHVMVSNNYPYKLYKVGTDLKPDVLKMLKGKFSYAAHVTLDTNEPAYPYRLNDKLTFPVGTFDAYLTTAMTDYATARNHIKHIHKIAVYKHTPLFKSYVKFFYAEKLKYQAQGNDAFAYVCKIMLNSLYGKFGQRVPELVYQRDTDLADNYRELIYDADNDTRYVKQCFYGLEEMYKLHMQETNNSMPIISAQITDYARLYLWQLCLKAGMKNLYYVDTDSLIVNQAGYNKLKTMLDKTEIGKLKTEGTSETIEIIGLKNYVFAGIHKLKGVPVKHEKLTPDTYEYKTFPGIITELREGIEKNYRIRTTVKTIKRVYDKGTITVTGKVKPYVLP